MALASLSAEIRVLIVYTLTYWQRVLAGKTATHGTPRTYYSKLLVRLSFEFVNPAIAISPHVRKRRVDNKSKGAFLVQALSPTESKTILSLSLSLSMVFKLR